MKGQREGGRGRGGGIEVLKRGGKGGEGGCGTVKGRGKGGGICH